MTWNRTSLLHTLMIFIDTNVFLYAAGADNPLRKPCQQVLQDAVSGAVEGVTSTEVVQEILYVLIRRGLKEKALVLAGEILHLFPELLPVTRPDMQRTTELLREHPDIQVRDALHVATMLNNGIGRIVSADRDFEKISGVHWLNPATWSAP